MRTGRRRETRKGEDSESAEGERAPPHARQRGRKRRMRKKKKTGVEVRKVPEFARW